MRDELKKMAIENYSKDQDTKYMKFVDTAFGM